MDKEIRLIPPFLLPNYYFHPLLLPYDCHTFQHTHTPTSSFVLHCIALQEGIKTSLFFLEATQLQENNKPSTRFLVYISCVVKKVSFLVFFFVVVVVCGLWSILSYLFPLCLILKSDCWNITHTTIYFPDEILQEENYEAFEETCVSFEFLFMLSLYLFGIRACEDFPLVSIFIVCALCTTRREKGEIKWKLFCNWTTVCLQ